MTLCGTKSIESHVPAMENLLPVYFTGKTYVTWKKVNQFWEKLTQLQWNTIGKKVNQFWEKLLQLDTMHGMQLGSQYKGQPIVVASTTTSQNYY